ncbi:MAG: bleomycin resistance protein, partial [Vicinamibacteria bacterium]
MTLTMTTEMLSLQPFVPSGPDFEGARALFLVLGFEEIWSSGGYVGFRQGAARFILQDFNDA